MKRGNTTRNDVLAVVLLGLLGGALITFSAWLRQRDSIRLPDWTEAALFGAAVLGVLVYGGILYCTRSRLSRSGVIATVITVLLFDGIGLASAAYIGPQRSVTTTVWERENCQYRAYTPVPSGWCYLTLYLSPSSCPSTSSIAGYFNRAPTACGTSWPGTCGAGISCTITLQNDNREGCSSGQTGCTSHSSTTTYPPATVSGSTVCTLPGNAGWCRGTATINLSGSEPLSPPYSLTYFEGSYSGSSGTLCSAPSCAWAFPEGTTDLSYWVHSSFGDTSTMSSASMKVDSVAPVVTLSIPSPDGLNGWFISAVSASASATDATSGVSGSAGINGGGATFTPSSDGVYDLTATALDNAGNTGSATGTLRLDSTAPVPGFSLPGPDGTNGWYVSPVVVVPDGSDATSGVAGQEVSPDNTTWSPSITVFADGTHPVYTRISDMAGNTAASAMTVRVDSTAPVAGFSIPSPDGKNGWYVIPVTVTPAGSDATSGIALQQVSLDNDSWDPSVTLSTDGVYTVYSRAADNAGNPSAVISRTVSLDTTPPEVSLALPLTGSGWYTSQPTITTAASDATSGVEAVEYSADGNPWAIVLPTLADGTHTLQARVTDNAGNVSTSAPSTIQVDTAGPQSAFVSPVEGSSVVAAGILDMSGATSDVTSGVAGAQISLDDGATWLPLTVSGGSWSYSWDTGKVPNGVYEVLVSGSDVAGNQEHTAHLTVQVANDPPTVSITKEWIIWQTAAVRITSSILPVTNARITISNLAGDEVQSFDYADGDLPGEFRWDGLTSQGTAVPFGLYTVKVEVWDAYGDQSSDSGFVLVPAPQPTATDTPAPTTILIATTLPTRAAAVTRLPEPSPTPMPLAPEPTPTQISLPPKTTPAPIPQPQPVSESKDNQMPMSWRKIDPIFLWPAVALGAFLAVLGASTFSDQKHKAYRNLQSAMEKIMQQRLATRAHDEKNKTITDKNKKGK